MALEVDTVANLLKLNKFPAVRNRLPNQGLGVLGQMNKNKIANLNHWKQKLSFIN